MPTRLHNSVTTWLFHELYLLRSSGALTVNEFSSLEITHDTTFEMIYPPYQGSRKQPDLSVQPNTLNTVVPPLVVEVGYSQSYPSLLRDVDLWLIGGCPDVKAVILVKWTCDRQRVRGQAEIWKRDHRGNPRLEQSETVFPDPNTGNPQLLVVHRRDLFGSAILAGRNPRDSLTLDIQRLRDAALVALTRMGLTPA